MSELQAVRAEARALARALRPGAAIPPVLAELRARLVVLESQERQRVSEHRSSLRRARLGSASCSVASEKRDEWIATFLPDGTLSGVGDASRECWALTRNGEAVAWFKGRREAEAACRGARSGSKARDHAEMIGEACSLLERIYRVHAARGRARRQECAELEWRLRILLDGWATESVIDRIARSRRGDASRWLERLGGERVAVSVWSPETDIDLEEVF